ncbi:MAG: dipeptidase [Lachnospiraceae bacterium]
MKVVDMHCDTISALLQKKRAGEKASLRENTCQLDLKKMQVGDYLLQNFALFVEMEACEDSWQEVQELLKLYEEEIQANTDLILPVLTGEDIGRNRKAGKMSALLTVEEGGVCGGSLAKLDMLYEQGVRMMTLSWNYPNELGYPNLDRERGRAVRQAVRETEAGKADEAIKAYLNTPDVKNGLTETGRAFVSRMEELGMIIDVSHMSDAGFYNVLECTRKPLVASHSNAREVCPCVRNLSNDMIQKLAERGGVMGLNFCADFLTQRPYGEPNPGTIAAIVTHAKHIANLGGIECLGLGSDFDGIDIHEELPGADCMGRLWEALKQGGFKESALDKIYGENVLRLYREVMH